MFDKTPGFNKTPGFIQDTEGGTKNGDTEPKNNAAANETFAKQPIERNDFFMDEDDEVNVVNNVNVESEISEKQISEQRKDSRSATPTQSYMGMQPNIVTPQEG